MDEADLTAERMEHETAALIAAARAQARRRAFSLPAMRGATERALARLLAGCRDDFPAIALHIRERDGLIAPSATLGPPLNTDDAVGKNTRQIVFTAKLAASAGSQGQRRDWSSYRALPRLIRNGRYKGTTIQDQTRQCLANIQAILGEAGSSLDKVVSVTVVLADEDDFAGMNEEWLKWFPSKPPARQGAKLPVRVPGLKVSLAAIAEA
jgi:2-iminobutanoate/2-iminopropanoate deaminase